MSFVKSQTRLGIKCVGRQGGAINGLPFGRGDKEVSHGSWSDEAGCNRSSGGILSITLFLGGEEPMLFMNETDFTEAIVNELRPTIFLLPSCTVSIEVLSSFEAAAGF